MILYCQPCDEIHEFTFVESERMFYAFQDRLTQTSIADPIEHADIDRPLFLDSATGKISYICFKDILEFSRNDNENADWTSEQVAARRHHVRDVDGSETKELGTERPMVTDWSKPNLDLEPAEGGRR